MQYLDEKNQIIEVRPGLGGDCFIVVRVNPRTGAGHRIKSKLLPPRETREEVEADLKAYWLGKKLWKRVPDWPASDKCVTRPRCTGCPTKDGRELCSPEELDGTEISGEDKTMRKPLVAGEEISRKYKNAKHQKKDKSPSPQPSPPRGEGEPAKQNLEVEMNNKPVKDIGKNLELEKTLKPYADGLPYDRNRVIEETKFLMRHEVIAKYEIGKRLILLREQEGVRTCGQILEEHFPGISRQRAYEYMMFSRKVAALPKVRDFAEGNGNWKKCLALLEFFDEDELKALEAGEPVAGKTLDDVDKMSFREVKKALRKEKNKVERGQEQLAEQEEKNRDLEKQLKEAGEVQIPKDEKEQLKILKKGRLAFWSAYVYAKQLKPEELSPRMKQEYITFYAYLVKMSSLELGELMKDPTWEEFEWSGYDDFDLGGKPFPTGEWENR